MNDSPESFGIDPFQSLMQTLQKPEFYPHPVISPIECLQTHCSAVFLTGDYAYKLKKPVNLGFLDYSTAEKRRHFLEEELRLNVPVAPDIYQEVLAVKFDGKQWQWGEKSGDDYVLKMAQFPQSCLLLSMFEEGTLSESQIIRLGQRVAQFHQDAVNNEEINSFGDADVIWQSVRDNFLATEKYLDIAQDREKYEDIRRFSENFYDQKRDIFKERQALGKIRECHGDLHLRNLCEWRGKIQLFDRIEFNKPFRFVDVMYDIAFTVMDLEAKGRSDWAYLFLNTYLEQTGDWHGLQVLPFYLCRQAYVRAKVISFLLDDANLTETAKIEALTTAKSYYQLAWQYAQTGKQSQRKIILMAGLSGSGKSTIAKQLAQQLLAVQIRSDAVRKHLAGVPLNQPGRASLYLAAMTETVYRQLLNLAQLIITSGFNVILDAKFDREQWRSPIIEFAEQEKIFLTIVHCDAPMEVLEKRLKYRQGDISDAKQTLLALQALDWQGFSELEEPFVFHLDTTNLGVNQVPTELLQKILPSSN